MWRARPITSANAISSFSLVLGSYALEFAVTSLPIDPMPLLAFCLFDIASFSRPRPVAMALVDPKGNNHRLLHALPC